MKNRKWKRHHKNFNTFTSFGDGVRFFRRADLVDPETGEKTGKWHVLLGEETDGLCLHSQKDYFDRIKGLNLEIMDTDKFPNITRICMNCVAKYKNIIKNRRIEMAQIKVDAKDIINVNGVEYVRRSVIGNGLQNATDELLEPYKSKIDDLRMANDSLANELEKANNRYKYISGLNERLTDKINQMTNGGEVRTIQAVEYADFLTNMPGRRSDRVMRTKITLKKTDVHYKSGQKVRIIIEE